MRDYIERDDLDMFLRKLAWSEQANQKELHRQIDACGDPFEVVRLRDKLVRSQARSELALQLSSLVFEAAESSRRIFRDDHPIVSRMLGV